MILLELFIASNFYKMLKKLLGKKSKKDKNPETQISNSQPLIKTQDSIISAGNNEAPTSKPSIQKSESKITHKSSRKSPKTSKTKISEPKPQEPISPPTLINSTPTSSDPNWENFYHDVTTAINFSTNSLVTSYRANDSEDIIIGDLGADFQSPRVRVFNHKNPPKQIPLTGTPSFILSCQQASSPQAVLVVCCQNSLFVYKNYKPFYRWALPKPENLETTCSFLSEEEELAWNNATDPKVLAELLLDLETISSKSKNFLKAINKTKFLMEYPGDKIAVKTNHITGCATVKKDRYNDRSSEDTLIVTDDGGNFYWTCYFL